MKICFLGAVFLFVSLSTVSALCQNDPAPGRIPEEECELYRLALKELEVRASVDGETLSGSIGASVSLLGAENGFDPEVVKNFNERNEKAYRLSEDFVQETRRRDSGIDFEERKRVTFSRIGFDGKRRNALLLAAVTFYLPEDIMNEGFYVFFEKKNGLWKIAGTAGAWNMRLGPVR